MDKALSNILVCPLCKSPLVYHATDEQRPQAELICRADKLAYPIRNLIPVMIPDQARSLSDDELAHV